MVRNGHKSILEEDIMVTVAKLLTVNIGVIFLLSFFACNNNIEPPSSREPTPLLVDNFNNCLLGYNILGGLSGTWNKFPDDTTQGIMDYADDKVKYGEGEGCSLRLEYDVDSPNPALNGYFFFLSSDTLKGQDLTPYDTLVFFAKGDEEKGFTSKFKVELKRPEYTGEAVCTTAKGVNRLWQQIKLPFDSFRPYGSYQTISDWSKVTKLLITFEDNNVDEDKKSGTIYLDDVYFH